MKYPKRSQYKYAKSPDRIRNWPEYEAGLRRRGDLTFWLSDDAINSWQALPSGKPGGQRIYEVNPLACPRCGDEMRIVAFITEPKTIDRILEHLRTRTKNSRRRQRAPPRRWKSAASTAST